MKTKIKSILIFGQGERGGTDYVLKSLADWLERNGYNVNFSDNWNRIEKQNYSLIILPTSRMHFIPALNSKDFAFQCSKFVIWCMGSLAFHDAYYNGRKIKSHSRALLKLYNILINSTSRTLFNEGSLIFTDEVGMYSDLIHLRDHSVNLPEIIFPVPIKFNTSVSISRFENKVNTIAWVGRIDTDFKILPLIQLIEDCAAAMERKYLGDNLQFIIVGSGNAMTQLMECISRYREIHFELHSWLNREELDALFLNRIDILFAMGSSALLGASLGVPVVIVNPYSHVNERKPANYRWIDQTVGHSLGEFPETFCKPNQLNKTFSELLNSLCLQTKSRQSKDFARKFDEDLVFGRLMARNLPLDISGKAKRLLNILSALHLAKKAIKTSIGFVRRIKVTNDSTI